MPAAAQTKKTGKKATVKPAPRVRRLDRRGRKKAVKTSTHVRGGMKLLGRSLKHLWQHRKLFFGIFLIHLVLYVFLVRGLATGFQLGETQEYLRELFGDELGTAETGVTLLSVLASTAGSAASDAGGVYQLVLLVLVSLAVIWSLRHSFEQKGQVKVRDAFYAGTAPFVPFLLVGLIMMLQLVPALITTSLYGIVSSNGIAVGAIEQIGWFVLLLLGVGISFFWLSSSLFALYIVTLPNMTPLAALRSARRLVRYRRWLIVRRLLIFPLIVLVFFLLVFFPLVLVAPLAAELLFMVLSLGGLIVFHSYFYALYRELL